MRASYLPLLIVALLLAARPGAARAADAPHSRLVPWERGIAVGPRDQPEMLVYLWFYEWNMFDAVAPGQHTQGTYKNQRTVTPDGLAATIVHPQLRLEARAVDDGAELTLTATNRSEHPWPEVAAIIPCFNPGPEDARNAQLANTHTYFLGPGGLEQLAAREIHFHHRWRELVDRQAVEGRQVFSDKWPASPVDAQAGLLIRTSTDGRWVCGIVWEDALSAQGHNPWQCMHLSVRVGPLAVGESKTVRGKMYLLAGDKDECLRRMAAEYPWSPAK